MINSIRDVLARGLRDAGIALLGAALAWLIPGATRAQTATDQHEPSSTNATHSEQPNTANTTPQPGADPQAAKAKEGDAYGSTPDKVKYPGLGPGANPKVETTIGPVKARLYGTVLLNISISDSAEVGQDIPLWPLPGSVPVTFPDGTTERAGTLHDTIFTARQSIFGFTFEPSKASSGEWSPSALVEFDFFGSRPVDALQPQGRVFNQPRLRKAYFELQKGNWKILAGQDDVIISPLDPVSLSHVAVPLGATAGDLWGRLPQVRVEKAATHGDFSTLFQFGILRPDFADPQLGDLPASRTSVDSLADRFRD